MSHPVARTFDALLSREYKIFDRKDTAAAFAKAHDKETFRNNLDAWCRRRAFDATVEVVARQFKTRDVDQIAAILRRAGVVFLADQNTAINRHSLH